MSSLNPHFTFHYSQPEEYHFSHDSVFLAREAFAQMPPGLQGLRGLDLCAGCGIVGLDFLYHLRQNQRTPFTDFDFLEVQALYQPHFVENCRRFGEGLPSSSFLLQNYDILQTPEFRGRYDVILSNPPYFRPGQGKMSPSEFKNRCRFFLDSDFQNLLQALDNALSDSGRAYILLRDLQDHGWNPLAEARCLLAGRRELTVIADVRGTPLVRVEKKEGC
ncbi:MAG: methyltransferase [Bdellovibrio sp.]